MKKFIPIIIGLLLLITIPVIVFFVGKSQELRSKAAPATTLSLSPASAVKAIGDTFSFDVIINTGDNRVTAVQIALLFDASVLEATSITNGPLAPNIAAAGVVSPGAASITVRATSTTNPIKGTGVVATIRMKVIGGSATPSTVRFDQSTIAASIGETQTDVLVSTTPASITVTQGGASANSTQTFQADTQPTTSPTPTGILTPTSTPTGILSPTLTPTGILTPTPTEEPSAPVISIVVSGDPDTQRISSTPTFSGIAPAGSILTIVINTTEPITAAASASATGTWTYTTTTPITDGDHTITVTAQAPDGQSYVTSKLFTVGGIASATDLVSEELPTSGVWETTALCLGLAFLFIISGMIVWQKKSYE